MGLEQIKATYIDHMGSDLKTANMARVSMAKESTLDENGNLREEDVRLINYLARGISSSEYSKIIYEMTATSDPNVIKDCIKRLNAHQHWTPFAHNVITLRETVPLFVARQRFKHTVGFVYSEESRRYVDTPPEFFMPDEWRSRPEGSIKQGSSDIFDNTKNSKITIVSTLTESSCESTYNKLLHHNVAPEMARMVLPQSMLVTYMVTGSLPAFARAYGLRADSHAQLEIQHLAKQWDEVIRPLYPVSWSALVD